MYTGKYFLRITKKKKLVDGQPERFYH